ncbi:MAG TPA: S53 family peptidase [Terriglobales bacterium]|nr:S53 family peptidase [Terriglobales bacterium]
MPKTLVRPFGMRVVVCISAWLVLAVAAPAQIRNRILQNIGDTEPVVVPAPHPLARAEFDQGRVEGSLLIDHAAMVFKLAPGQQAALDKLLAEQQDPHSPNFRKWLTPEQYAARFGMSDSDLGKVTAWLKSQGLRVDGFSRGRNQVFFSGTADQVGDAFHTEFHRYLVEGETSLANAIEISVPQAISGMVLGFRGLENFRPRPRARVVARPNFTSHQTGNHFIAPGDFATIYSIPAGLDGTGQTIAVVGQTQINTSDIDAFRTAGGLPARTSGNFQQVLITGGGTGFSDGDEVEANLDLEWSNAVAPKATILYVYAGANSTTKNVFDAMAFAIDNNLAPVISTSYGNCEANLTGFVQTLQQEAQQANAQGQTITAASGDSGAGDCEAQNATTATHGPAVDAPASIPEVTGIGGSEFDGGGTGQDPAGALSGGVAPTTSDFGATTFWTGTTGAADKLSSAKSYIPETTWNDTTAGSALSATGGGKSSVFSKPSWQVGAGVPNDASRDVPDVALSASPNHDGFLICSQSFFVGVTPAVTSCATGFRASDAAALAVVAGTSAGAPSFAGIVALLNQKPASHGLGNVNPMLYSLAASAPSAFHDITRGNNNVPCTQSSKGCPTKAPFQYGFSAGAGYDQVTGLGSVNVTNLANAWAGTTPSPDFTVSGFSATAAAPGQPATSQIVLESVAGFSGTVDLTCKPASASAQISCSLNPASVMVSTTGGTSTMTISTTAPHILSGTSASARPHGLGWLAAGSSVLLAGIFFAGGPPRRRRYLAGFGLMLMVFFAAGLGCGGGSSGSSQNAGTPAGTYSITVTATSGSSLSHTASIALIVQ